MTLTISKSNFKKNEEDPEFSKSLTADEVRELRDFYSVKYPDVTIVINGESIYGQNIISQTQEKFQAEEIDDYLQKSQSYPLAAYVAEHYAHGAIGSDFLISNMWGTTFENYFTQIDQVIPENFKTKYGNAINQLSDDQLRQLQEALEVLDEPIKNLILNQSQLCIEQLEKERNNICLSETKAKEEMLCIQGMLDENSVVGYVYTNGVQHSGRHFEIFIITPEEIIKPVHWNTEDYLVLDDTDYASVPKKLEKVVCPQADDRGCGTLGMSYLKELLKNNANQLREYTLTFFYIDNEGKKQKYFLPSPHVLRYSQSSRYNEAIRDLLLSDDEVLIIQSTNKRSDYRFPTIYGALTQSLEDTSEQLSEQEIAHNEELLENLESFRTQWVQFYEEQMEARELMNIESYNKTKNVYLSYKSRTAISAAHQNYMRNNIEDDTTENSRFTKIHYQPMFQSYLNDREQHLGYCAKFFDKQRGEIRAKSYQALIEQCSDDQAIVNLLFYALFASHDGEHLKQTIAIKLGYGSSDTALAHYKENMKRLISNSYNGAEENEQAFEDKRAILNEIIEKIVVAANNKKNHDHSDFTEALEIFRNEGFVYSNAGISQVI
jgi:hypothetical protein